MSGLIWIHTVRHSDCIPDFFFEKGDYEKKWQATKKHENYSVGKELKRFFFFLLSVKERIPGKVWFPSTKI